MPRIDSVRWRLTLYYVTSLAVSLLVVGGLIYILLARALYARVDASLDAVMQAAGTSLRNDLAEGQTPDDAARSTAAELASRLQMVAIYDDRGTLLADEQRDDELTIVLPALDHIPADSILLFTAKEYDDNDRHRMAIRKLQAGPSGPTFIAVIGSSLEPMDEELGTLFRILLYVVPIALLAAGVGGWFLAHRSLAPVVAMAARARRIGVEDLSARLPVANPGDELGHLAATFNELLGRLEGSLMQQRQFMADASHELRTPVTTVRTAAAVALQQPHRAEADYREALALVEQQTVRLSRIVNDMFTLARADAGNYPVRRAELYLDEMLEEAVQAARVRARTRGVEVTLDAPAGAVFNGDEELLLRLVGNLLDNAIRYAPSGTSVSVTLARESTGYAISVTDQGPGIPSESQARVFERFYRHDRSRARDSGDGAGLGLALARWIAQVHGGTVELTRSRQGETTFTAFIVLSSGGL